MDAFAKAFVGIANNTAQDLHDVVLVNGICYTLDIPQRMIGDLAEMYQTWLNQGLAGEGAILDLKTTLPFGTSAHPDQAELCLDKDDLASFYYVIDRIIAGADPVSLDGTLEVKPKITYLEAGKV